MAVDEQCYGEALENAPWQSRCFELVTVGPCYQKSPKLWLHEFRAAIKICHMKILAVDPGQKRVGVAACDAMGLTTRLLPVILFRGNQSLIQRLVDLVAGEDFQKVLIGLPLHMDGQRGDAALRSENLAKSLQAKLKERKVPCSVVLWDERLTSDEAERRLREQGIAKHKAKAYLDSLAAEVLLEDYLRSQS